MPATDDGGLPPYVLAHDRPASIALTALAADSTVCGSDASETSETSETTETTMATSTITITTAATTPTSRMPPKPHSGARRPRVPLGPLHTHPLFPELPQYGPPSLLRWLKSSFFRVSSFFLSLAFLGIIVVGAMTSTTLQTLRRLRAYLHLRNPDASRPFYAEEQRRRQQRRALASQWTRRRQQQQQQQQTGPKGHKEEAGLMEGHVPAGTPTEGGPDPLVCDVGYYARRVGLDVEEYVVQTEDGFLIDLWHVYDPAEQQARPAAARGPHGPGVLFDETDEAAREARQQQLFAARAASGQPAPRFPVLLVHGLLQSAGAYCVNDEDSLAFYLCRSGYDVWLGNNRCGFRPRHVTLNARDPRMWRWNIRHMGVYDLAALTSRVLRETSFARLGLVCHSQGTTETLVALAREQRPALGRSLTVFCALAPAAYAGPLIGKLHFRFLRAIAPVVFRLVFGLHDFIPLMMDVRPWLPARLYAWLGYRVFAFLFRWSDARWERDLRARMFQFAPVHISTESMYWWLGSEGFAHHRCILATRAEWHAEEFALEPADRPAVVPSLSSSSSSSSPHQHHHHPAGSRAWFDEQVPPFALWVCGRDNLVDGRRLLRRLLPAAAFARLARHGVPVTSGATRSLHEPHVRVVHAKILPDFEHLDVLWAVDAVDEVFCEIRDVLWKTCPVRAACRVPLGCEAVEPWVDALVVDGAEDDDVSSSAAE